MITLVGQVWQVLSIHVAQDFVLHILGLFTLALNAEVWQVLSTVDPESNGALNLQDDRNQNFLNHFGVLDALRITQNLFNSRINFGPSCPN